eukprot:1159840-Pelagomonas_calceolata.AAC.13
MRQADSMKRLAFSHSMCDRRRLGAVGPSIQGFAGLEVPFKPLICFLCMHADSCTATSSPQYTQLGSLQGNPEPSHSLESVWVALDLGVTATALHCFLKASVTPCRQSCVGRWMLVNALD